MRDALVLGAGVAGLAAAARLREAGLDVVVVDARARLGGRIHTLRGDGWPIPMELGAEFLHGRDPRLMRLIEGGKLHAGRVEERHWLRSGNRLALADDAWEEALALMDDGEAPRDRSFRARVAAAGKRGAVAELAVAYVEGFHAAPARRASTRAITQQQRAADEVHGDELRRVDEGYDAVALQLARAFADDAAAYRLGTTVERVAWRKHRVELHARSSLGMRLPSLTARALVVTLPLGVLQRRRGAAAVTFSPRLPEPHRRAIDALGMADVVKLLYRFRLPFWKAHERRLGALSFAHDPRAAVPTWWRPLPFGHPILVGWAGGPKAARLAGRPAVQVARLGLSSLARLMATTPAKLEAELFAWRVCDWRADPFAAGAYSWVPVGAQAAQAALAAPVAETLYFAGEATHAGGASGTVHGAVATGERAAEELLAARR